MMKTTIQKTYKDGFFLSEQDLRRIHHLLVEAAAKVSGQSHKPYIYVRQTNGTILELEAIDEVFAIDNIGPREIDYLYLEVSPTRTPHLAPEPRDVAANDWVACVQFERLRDYYPSKMSMVVDVRGGSRDWVVLTAGELDERLRSVRRLSVARFLHTPYAPVALLLACMALGTLLLIALPVPAPAYLNLEQAYIAGKVANPTEALILLEKTRHAKTSVDLVLRYILTFLSVTALVSLAAPAIVRRLALPYVFYWGDYVAVYKRRRGFVFVLWTVVVLGVAVGVLSSYITKLLGL